jgi:hypothetical protein
VSTTTPTKTVQTALLAWQTVNGAAVAISSALDCASIFAAAVAIKVARTTSSAQSPSEPIVRIEASHKSSGTDSFVPIYQYQVATGSSVASTTFSGAASAAASSFGLSSGTNIAKGDILFLGDASASNYELVRVKAVSGGTITPEDALTNAHSSGATVTDQAEMVFPAFDLTPYRRIRAVVDNSNGNNNIIAEVSIVTLDNLSTT